MKHISLITMLVALAACVPMDPIQSGPLKQIELRSDPPINPNPDACWGNQTTPAVFETIKDPTEPQIEEGTLLGLPVQETKLVRDRAEVWFETPCPGALVPDFTESLQRALAVRGLYTGPVTGELDTATRSAIRAYQAPRGLDSDVLSLAAARELGLAPVPRES